MAALESFMVVQVQSSWLSVGCGKWQAVASVMIECSLLCIIEWQVASGKWQVSESRVGVRTVGGGRPVGCGPEGQARTCVAKWHNTIALRV